LISLVIILIRFSSLEFEFDEDISFTSFEAIESFEVETSI